MTEQLEIAISGSFKFKPEIDELIDEFADYHVTVIEPKKGWLYIASGRLPEEGFRPLPNERGLNIGQIENLFMNAVRQSDFLYVNNQGGYLGESTAFEIGGALAMHKPVFMREHFTLENFEGDLIPYYFYNDATFVATPKESVDMMRELQFLVREFREISS